MQALERDPERAMNPSIAARQENERTCPVVFKDWGQASPAAGMVVCLGGTAYGIVVKKYPVAAFFDFLLILFLIDFLRIRALKPAHDMEVNLHQNRAQMDENQKLIEDQRKMILELQSSLVNVKSELQKYTNKQADVNQDRNEQLKRIEDLTLRLTSAQKEYDLQKNGFAKLEEDSKKLEGLTKSLQEELDQEKKTAQAIKVENEKLAKNNLNLKSRLKEIDKENSEYANQVEKHDEANNDLRKEIVSLTEKVEQIKKEKEELVRIVEKAKHLEETNNQLQEKLKQLSELEVKLAQEVAKFKKPQ